jgi:uncharacterized protein
MEFQTQPIELFQKEQIEKIRTLGGNKLSANTFDSLYLWQQQMGLSVYITDDFFAVKCSERGQNTWFFPCGSKEKIERFIKNGMSDKDFSLCYIDEADAEWLKKMFPTKWELCREEDSDEYICRIADYIGLNGGKYTGVRHKINRIVRENSIKASVISDETVSDALAVVSEWDKLPHHIGNNNLVDSGVSDRALLERKQLGIDGVIVYIDEEPMAVFAGFPIDGDTVDAMVGKCRHDAPGGFVYYAIYEYFKQAADKYTYCNLEEDLGISGIRMIKEGLRPERKNQIWTAVQK